MQKLASLLIGSALVAAGARPARADETPSTRTALAARGGDRPYTLAQLGVGFLTLPAADLCLKSRPCTKGDTSVEVDFWQMYRANRHFAVGAGATLALNPTTDSPSSGTDVERSHTRSYFLVEGQARYYIVDSPFIEGWFGATAGGVIVSDRYVIDEGDSPTAALIGPRASTVRTEGATIGALIGAQWSFAPNWAVGLSARYMRWFLPSVAATTVFLDRATLTDEQSVLNVGIACSYRIAL